MAWPLAGYMERPAAVCEQMIDDARVRVSRFDFAAGAETGWHCHEMDYVICAITDCQMTLEEPCNKTRDVLVPAGTAYRRDLGVEHNVINAGTAAMSFVEIELK
jgi:quercetin dioxygenase-like cupin family protein